MPTRMTTTSTCTQVTSNNFSMTQLSQFHPCKYPCAMTLESFVKLELDFSFLEGCQLSRSDVTGGACINLSE